MKEKKVTIVPHMKPFDLDILMERIGGLGLYQKRRMLLYTITFLLKIVTSYSYIFTTLQSPHRCLIPQCDNLADPIFWTDWTEYAIPSNFRNPGVSCERYEFVPDDTNVTNTCYIGNFNTDRLLKCDNFVFMPTNYRSIADDFEIYCRDNYWKLSGVATIRFIALLLSVSIAGYLGDKFGRRKLFIYGIIISSMLALLKSFSPNYETFAALEFAGAVAESGVFSSYFNFVMEMLLPKHRITGTFLMLCLAPLGEILLGTLAWSVSSWRTILRIGSIPSLLLIVYQHLLPESPRWLVSKGRYDEANQLISEIAEENNIFFTSDPINEQNINYLKSQKPKNDSINNLFASNSMSIRFMVILLCWLFSYFISSGLFVTSTALKGFVHLNFISISFMGIPANLIVIISCKKLGRRMTIILSFFINALMFTFFILAQKQEIASLCIYLITKCATTVSMHTLFAYTTEMFPTLYRQTITGYAMTFGRAGSLAGSLVPLVGLYWEYLPQALFAIVSIVAGVIALLLSETFDVKLPDSFEDSRKNVRKPVKNAETLSDSRF